MAGEREQRLRDRARHGHLRSRIHNGAVQLAFGVLTFAIIPFGFALAMTLAFMAAFHAFSVRDRFAEVDERTEAVNQLGKISLYVSLQFVALLASAWTGLALGELLRDSAGWVATMMGF